MNACCPPGHFGSQCSPCPGQENENICSGRGQCDGDGTKQGLGKCKCNTGFAGNNCAECDKNYFSSDSKNESCLPCDSSCASSCSGAGPKACHVCRSGYIWDQDSGCVDINECLQADSNACKESQYCFNTVGSYQCYRKCLLEQMFLCPVRGVVSRDLYHKCLYFKNNSY